MKRHVARRVDLAECLREGQEFVPVDIRALISKGVERPLLHPYCNDGRELLDIIGATGRGVGVDFVSDLVVRAAEAAERLGRRCVFHCEDVATWMREQECGWADGVFLSLGSLWWIADLSDFYKQAWRLCRDGSRLVIWDFHPMLYTLDEALRVSSDYPFVRLSCRYEHGVLDYDSGPPAYRRGRTSAKLAEDFGNKYPVTEFQWGLGTVVRDALAAGWSLASFEEYPWIFGERYLPILCEREGHRFGMPPGRPQIPLTFSMVFAKDIQRTSP